MELRYLLFDVVDDETGACSFDALASVAPDRLAGLLQEIEAVLAWACRGFGPPAAEEGGGEWDFALHAVDDREMALAIAYDAGAGRVRLAPVRGRVTVALTVSGTRSFADAFTEAFPDAG